MKITNSPASRYQARGFSLVELMTVITIIVILASIVIAAVSAVNKTNARKETIVRLARMKNGIENYASDNSGIYPFSNDVLSREVYKALSGDFTGRGTTSESPPEGQTYWPELLNKNSGLVRKINGEFVIIDKYNNSFRYRSGTDLQGSSVPEARNEDFDAWSLGPDGEPSGENIDSNLKSEETEDDIWN